MHHPADPNELLEIASDELRPVVGDDARMGPDHLWVADITYIRLKREFVYLAVILDAYSREVVGWDLDRTMTARLTVGALEQAIADRQPQPGLVHHSDRGFQ